MLVQAIKHLQTYDFTMNIGDIRTIEDENMVNSFIASGYVVEVEQCSCCGSYVPKK